MLRATQLRSRPAGAEFQLESPSGSALVKTRLVGHFNVSNALAVLGALLAKGAPLRAALDAIEALEPAPGRMQQVGGQDAPLVVIDYAHTPDALEKTLARCARWRANAAASCGACSAAAATAIRASVRRWAPSPRWPSTCWSPATIRAAKSRARSSSRSSPAWTRTPGLDLPGDRGPRRRHPVGGEACRQGRT
jgi:folylpolyglutamate synthase/dihydropteroate synthase